MTKYKSLDHFKNSNKISDAKGSKISFIFKEIYEEYSFHDFSNNKRVEKLLNQLIEESKEVNPSLIPYSEITNIIFTNYYNFSDSNSSFTEKFKSEFEKYVVHNFGEGSSAHINPPKDNDDVYSKPSITDHIELIIDDDERNSLLVVYKIIQHAELAISQKQSLYEELKDEVNNLNNHIFDATQKYDNMMSNFISILGIFAAIMMATFGAIQGFSAIFTNENNYNLTTIILISCFGLFALISILFILLHSIAKLIDKGHMYYGSDWFSKYPIYSHTLLIISFIFISALTHFFKLNPPNYFPDYLKNNLWSFFFLTLILFILAYFVHRLIARFQGYYHINNYLNSQVLKLKNKLGINTLIKVIIYSTVSILVIAIFIMINNIFDLLSFFKIF